MGIRYLLRSYRVEECLFEGVAEGVHALNQYSRFAARSPDGPQDLFPFAIDSQLTRANPGCGNTELIERLLQKISVGDNADLKSRARGPLKIL
jgi:hypothetical protein